MNFSVAIVCMTYDKNDNTTIAENSSVIIRETDLLQWLLFDDVDTYEDADCSPDDGGDDDETDEVRW